MSKHDQTLAALLEIVSAEIEKYQSAVELFASSRDEQSLEEVRRLNNRLSFFAYTMERYKLVVKATGTSMQLAAWEGGGGGFSGGGATGGW